MPDRLTPLHQLQVRGGNWTLVGLTWGWGKAATRASMNPGLRLPTAAAPQGSPCLLPPTLSPRAGLEGGPWAKSPATGAGPSPKRPPPRPTFYGAGSPTP